MSLRNIDVRKRKERKRWQSQQTSKAAEDAATSQKPELHGTIETTARKRPANHASHIAIIYENVCPLTGKLMGTHDDGYCSAWS